MSRVAILKIGTGDFHQGFDVSLQLREEAGSPFAELTGRLPANPDLESLYVCWQQLFRSLSTSSRRSPRSADADWQIDQSLTIHRSTRADVEACRQWMLALETNMATWLQSTSEASWQRIRERLSQELARYPNQSRVVIQARDPQVWKLPWHVWDILSQYANVGLGYSLPDFEQHARIEVSPSNHDRVRVLAVLGDATAIDLQPDQAAIQRLSDAQSVFLSQPTAPELIRTLRQDHGWDIFFFAGHSQTQHDIGRIYLSDQESLAIDQFKHALREAIHQGLKIAIFNSCDGWGLAQQLASLQIPVVIFMQEEVPDQVAQSFLKELLAEYAQAQPLYTAVRRAQERLEEFQDLPGATWLPVIYQNLADIPPTWQNLHPQPQPITQPLAPRSPLSPPQRLKFPGIILSSLLVTGLMMGLRWLGTWQTWELQAFNHLMQQLPTEPADDRLLLIGVDEEDLRRYGHPLPDAVLTQLLAKLQRYQPAAIGLDIIRDRPVGTGYQRFTTHLKQQQNLITICAFDPQSGGGIAAPPQVPEAQLGFVDLYPDDLQTNRQDYTVRRYLLSRTANPIAVPSRCRTPYSLAWQLTYEYLSRHQITVQRQNNDWQFGSVIVRRLENHRGGYQTLDASGNQLLIRYRHTTEPDKIAQQVTLRDVLTDSNSFDPDWIKDRVVLIGVTAPSIPDYHDTPYGRIRGLQVHAHVVSQLLSAAAGDRPLLWWWTDWQDGVWVLVWAFTGGAIIWLLPVPLYRGIAFCLSLLTLYAACWLILVNGGWIPLVPAAFSLIGTGVSAAALPAVRSSCNLPNFLKSN
ncbi:CHASE2 domain-containing protein [Pantanalinema sp. GBBB05]|uniref:CHASE2 domain-containing protein n=1 Tax=Pantanalinema sp. GBBB05 TaxID=2604139 RepID=UPI003D81A8B5